MSLLLSLLKWLAAQAGDQLATARWDTPSTADRAGTLVPAPDDSLEPEVGRSLGVWALWAALGVVLLLLAAGYLRRRWKARGSPLPAWLTWRAPR